MAVDEQVHFSWPVLVPTLAGVNRRAPVALGTVDVTVMMPVVSAIATADTNLVAPGKEYPELAAVTDARLPIDDVVSVTASLAGAAIRITSDTLARVV